jgi:hypothetical protein
VSDFVTNSPQDAADFNAQELRIERVENPFSIYFPIHIISTITYADAPYCFIRQRMSKDEFKTKYPSATMGNFEGEGTGDINWVDEDSVYVAEYFYVEESAIVLCLLSDGSIVKESDVPEGAIVTKKRSCVKKSVKWCLITGSEIIEKKDWPTENIPVFPALGDELINFDESGKKTYIGLIRFMKDPQRMYNYWITTYTEQLALQPKSPYMAAAGQTEKFPEWKTANTENHTVLRYSPVSSDGTLLPPPQRVAPPSAGEAIFRGIEIASQEMKEVSGIYDASLGSRSNETSGKAIIARQRQGDTANFHFIDNFALSIKHLCKVIVDAIPFIYDSERTVRILGEDMTEKVVTINSMHPDNDGRLYDLTVGKYDVVVTVGANYDTKRMETAESMANLLPQMPIVGQVAADLIMRMLDNPMSNEVADRIKRFIQAQPNMQGIVDDGKDADKIKPEDIQAMVQDVQTLQGQLQGKDQDIQQLQNVINNLQKLLGDKRMEIQARTHDTEVKAGVELEKIQAELAKEHLRQAHNITSGIVKNAAILHQIGNSEDKNNIAKPPAGDAETE